MTGLAIHPTTGVLYGATTVNSPASPSSLITINRTTGAGTVVGPFGVVGSLSDLTFSSTEVLHGFGGQTGDLYTVSLTTGAATSLGSVGVPPPTAGGGLAFAPSRALYLSAETDVGNLRTLNPANGATVASIPLTGGTNNQSSIGALAAHPNGTLYGADIDRNVAARPAQLITINPTTGAITFVGPSVNALDALAFDCPIGQVQFSSPTYSVNENGGSASIVVTRTGGSAGPLTVRLTTGNGSAQAGADYTAVDVVITFPDGDASPKTVQIPILDDLLVEGNETVNLQLSQVTGGTVGTPSSAVLTIQDNDTAPAPAAPAAPGQADVRIAKTGPANATLGSNPIYTITITNSGPATAENVTVNDPVPAGLTFVSNSGACVTVFPCALGSLAAGQTRIITTTLNVPQGYAGPDPIRNVATVSSTTADPNTTNNTAEARTTPQEQVYDPNNNGKGDKKDKDEQSRKTEEQELNEQHTNTGGKDQYAISGQVIAVEKSPDGGYLLVSIKTIDPVPLVVAFACPDGRCPDIVEKDLIEVDGVQGGDLPEQKGWFMAESFDYVSRAPRPR